MPRVIYAAAGAKLWQDFYRPVLTALVAMSPCVLALRLLASPALTTPATLLIATVWMVIGPLLLTVLLINREDRTRLRALAR